MIFMKVYIFRGANNVYGFTADAVGTILPSQYGPWKKYKDVEMSPDETGRIGVDSKTALRDIEQQGFHLTSAKIEFSIS